MWCRMRGMRGVQSDTERGEKGEECRQECGMRGTAGVRSERKRGGSKRKEKMKRREKGGECVRGREVDSGEAMV